MSLLNELGLKYRTDKAVDGKRGEPGKGHDYLRIYERFSVLERTEVLKVLEIGVQKGASIRMWEEYFPNATIYGLDIAESALNVTGDRIRIQLVDQSDAAALQAFAEQNGPFDLIVEDGSHIWSHQIIGLQTLLPHLKPGGASTSSKICTPATLRSLANREADRRTIRAEMLRKGSRGQQSTILRRARRPDP